MASTGDMDNIGKSRKDFEWDLFRDRDNILTHFWQRMRQTKLSETEISTLYRHFRHWLHRKFYCRQFFVQSVAIIFPKWRYFGYSEDGIYK